MRKAPELIRHGYMELDGKLVPKPYRPKTIGDGRRLIDEVFERNRWDESSRRKYFEMKGVEAGSTAQLSSDGVRTVLAAMERSRMIIFAD